MFTEIIVDEGDQVSKVDLSDWFELAKVDCKSEGGAVDHTASVFRHADGRVIVSGEQKPVNMRGRRGGKLLPAGATESLVDSTVHEIAVIYGLPQECAEQCSDNYRRHPLKHGPLDLSE